MNSRPPRRTVPTARIPKPCRSTCRYWEIPWLAYTYPWLDAAFQAVAVGQDAQAALAVAQARAERLISCAETSGGLADREQLRTCAREIDPEYP